MKNEKRIREKLLSIAHEIIRNEDLPLGTLKESIAKIYEDLCVLNYLEPKKEKPQILKKTATTQDSPPKVLTKTFPLDEIADIFEKAPPKKKSENTTPESPVKILKIPPKEPLKNTFKNFEKKQQSQKIPPINIGLNDRIAFVKSLFGEDTELYQQVIRDLNKVNTHEKSLEYLSDLGKQMKWNNKNEVTLRFKKLIKLRFHGTKIL